MARNFWWLFASYAVVWGALFLFVMQLLKRQAKLRREVDQLLRERTDGAQSGTTSAPRDPSRAG